MITFNQTSRASLFALLFVMYCSSIWATPTNIFYSLLNAPGHAYNGMRHGINTTCNSISYITETITSDSALQTYKYIGLSMLIIVAGKTSHDNYTAMTPAKKIQMQDLMCLSIATLCFATILDMFTNSKYKKNI